MSKKSADLSRTERARAEIERQEAAARRRNWIVGGVVALLVVVAVGVGFALTSSQDPTTTTTTDVPSGLSGWAVAVGDPSAPTKITIYEDPQCPVCAQFEAVTGKQVEQAVEDGRAQVDYRIVSFLDPSSKNEYSSRAASALMVVASTEGPEVFKKYHDLLYQRQPAEGTAGPENAQLVDWAVEAGADRAAVEQGILDAQYQQWAINAADQMSKEGVTGTPTIMIDGKVVGRGNPQEAVQALLAAIGDGGTSGSTGSGQ